jgi:LmbE family N-acetylglucosaminyl deacetylase
VPTREAGEGAGEQTSPGPPALRDVRRAEQRAAARRGRYAVAIQLDHPSAAVKRGVDAEVVRDLAAVLAMTRPHVVYTHGPADAHDTHVGVCVAALEAICSLPSAQRPERVLGCEVWRGLDWAANAQSLPLPLRDEPAWRALLGEFASQNAARPYAEGAPARARANAVFRESRAAGGHEPAWLALDLTRTDPRRRPRPRGLPARAPRKALARRARHAGACAGPPMRSP